MNVASTRTVAWRAVKDLADAVVARWGPQVGSA